MDTLVNLPGGNPRGRSKYYLNDAATVKKLKAAAKLPDITITPCQTSVQLKFNVGSYVEVVLRLLKYWETCEGKAQIPKDVDGLDVMVTKVETVEDAKGVNERHIVRLSVQGEQVTVSLWDTTCGMGVQAGSMLVPYTTRVLFPYLHEQIKLRSREIRESNDKVKTHGVTKVMTRTKRQELAERAAILESPARTASLSVTDLSSPAPIRLYNKILTWVSTPSGQPQEQEKEQEKDEEEQDEEEEQGLNALNSPLESVRLNSSTHPSATGVLALTYSHPKEQQSNKQGGSQGVVCFPCDNCDNVFTNELDLSNHRKEHISKVGQSVTDARPLTASGRLLTLTPNFRSQHIEFQEALNNDHVDDDLNSSEDESNDLEDACKVCKKTFRNVSNLQDHIIAKHGSQSESVLELLKLQQQLLKSILAGQATQLTRVNQIAIKQTCISDEMKEVKEMFSNSSSPSPPVHPSVVPGPAARARPVTPSYSQVTGQQQEREQQHAAPAPQLLRSGGTRGTSRC